MLSFKKSRINCAVVGCNFTYRNSPVGTKFFRFPNEKQHMIRRKAWITALNRETTDRKPWNPTRNSRVCSQHFVHGLPTRDPDSPGYIPSLYMTHTTSARIRQNTAKKVAANYKGRKLRRVKIETEKATNAEFSTCLSRHAMEVTLTSAIKTEPPLEDSEESPCEEPCRSTSLVHYETEEVLLVMPKTEPDYPEAEDSIKEEYPEYHNIKQEISIEEGNNEDNDILYKFTDPEEPGDKIIPGDRQFSCSICNKAFSRKSNLCRHMRTHNEEKDFKCDICLKGFAEKCSLKNHLLTHSKEKPFQCTICNRGYSQKKLLKKHVRAQHAEEYMDQLCTVCNRHFVDAKSLEVHLHSHIQGKKYTCSICSRDFCGKSGLKKHYSVHSDHRPFECSYCKKKFRRCDTLRTHIRRHKGKGTYLSRLAAVISGTIPS